MLRPRADPDCATLQSVSSATRPSDALPASDSPPPDDPQATSVAAAHQPKLFSSNPDGRQLHRPSKTRAAMRRNRSIESAAVPIWHLLLREVAITPRRKSPATNHPK